MTSAGARTRPPAVPTRAPSTAVPSKREPAHDAARQRRTRGGRQLFLPVGTGRFYSGHTGIAVAQLVPAFFGVGVIWSFIDGIVILAGRPTDPQGRPLRP